MKNTLTITVVANMTSNYSESLGNISSVQKVFKNQKVYAMRSRESLKNAIMVESGLYDDVQTDVQTTTQKLASSQVNVATCRALEAGYMNTQGMTYVRKSSFYLTDAISCDSFINETRFHNNLYLASKEAEKEGLNVQAGAEKIGLMPYQYEYDKSLKTYSMTIDLSMIGKDANFDTEADNMEKAFRVKALLTAVENLSLVVKGNLDNAEPVFAVGGFSDRKTHYFENVVKVEKDELILSDDLKGRVEKGFLVGLMQSHQLKNEEEIAEFLHPISMSAFFDTLRKQVDEYYQNA